MGPLFLGVLILDLGFRASAWRFLPLWFGGLVDPKAPWAHVVYTLALKYPYRDYFRAKV